MVFGGRVVGEVGEQGGRSGWSVYTGGCSVQQGRQAECKRIIQMHPTLCMLYLFARKNICSIYIFLFVCLCMCILVCLCKWEEGKEGNWNRGFEYMCVMRKSEERFAPLRYISTGSLRPLRPECSREPRTDIGLCFSCPPVREPTPGFVVVGFFCVLFTYSTFFVLTMLSLL